MSFIKYIMDENHYREVLSLVGKAGYKDVTFHMVEGKMSCAIAVIKK